jgi:hypothetical protein
MAENTLPDADQLLPLEKLVKIPRGKKQIPVTEELLPHIDLTTLNHTLEFKLRHYFTVSVKLKLIRAKRIETTVTISTRETDWPEPNQFFVDVFYAAVGAAARRTVDDLEEGELIVPIVYGGTKPLVIECQFKLLTGNTILAKLRDKLDRIKQELPGVLSVTAQGPTPGSSVPTDDDDDVLDAKE